MIFIHAVEVDQRLASHLVGPDPVVGDQLIGLSLSEFAIAATVLELDESATLIVIIVNHGSCMCFEDLKSSGFDLAPRRKSSSFRKATKLIRRVASPISSAPLSKPATMSSSSKNLAKSSHHIVNTKQWSMHSQIVAIWPDRVSIATRLPEPEKENCRAG
ncbi:hypothetical protein [Bradyrhizobium sp. SZCCHNR1015]|uniref:hypothetical protein n=1 Tax=Bradyrhizobium sp. SZCCHNR1015 TaxID=3057338 RepID=UPI0029166CFA|nr:hypothetical protein [Bradyrhizobium sp. SZCCHNR1015]